MNNQDTMPKKNLLSFQLNLKDFEKATDDEKLQQVRMSESTTFFKDGMRRLRKNKIAMASLSIIILIALIVTFVPMVYPYTYEQQLGVAQGKRIDKTYNNLAPFEYGETELERIANGEKIFPHIFGTDASGRDYAIRVIYGGRISLLVGFFAAIIVLIIGIVYGSIAGYFGGRVDLFMMRIVDIIYSLPDMLMIILFSVVLKQTLTPAIEGTTLAKMGTDMISIFIVFAILYWVGMARLVRGQILSIKQQEYVLAARSLGAKPRRIIQKHLLPNCMSVIIISTALQIPSAIFTESYLSFLGLGVSIPMPSLGSLASDALAGIYTYPYRLIIPAISIWLIVLSFNLLGDGLRDAFDPKLKK
ncbi:ABC transporter permease [Sedimentibacter hydroxybenzoicus DSM 7310]|uniref:ABC transporter permease n=1 Tax=Sedimentibacter hydroxybenzoicus DSM 7310 TaxID=1123245 RepID=A0A974GY33_SEDHY|nr:ABC transporter permease [Sedimentibacter hydroxybenzoicus]NYB75715.1 ABC transporter permease [Sedimentibacter hydroxybenzoicus DSM 7310]